MTRHAPVAEAPYPQGTFEWAFWHAGPGQTAEAGHMLWKLLPEPNARGRRWTDGSHFVPEMMVQAMGLGSAGDTEGLEQLHQLAEECWATSPQIDQLHDLLDQAANFNQPTAEGEV